MAGCFKSGIDADQPFARKCSEKDDVRGLQTLIPATQKEKTAGFSYLFGLRVVDRWPKRGGPYGMDLFERDLAQIVRHGTGR